jgi:hypothetical protein
VGVGARNEELVDEAERATLRRNVERRLTILLEWSTRGAGGNEKVRFILPGQASVHPMRFIPSSNEPQQDGQTG